VELVRGAEGVVDEIICKACCEKYCSKVTTLASGAADPERDAVNGAREAVNLARVVSIPARDAVD
jgi:hypothetical protein